MTNSQVSYLLLEGALGDFGSGYREGYRERDIERRMYSEHREDIDRRI
jgi:hypothetical protein